MTKKERMVLLGVLRELKAVLSQRKRDPEDKVGKRQKRWFANDGIDCCTGGLMAA